MSYRPKRKNELERDELNLKSHLNTSLDIEGISVSEELLNRTLEAIKQQGAEDLGVGKGDVETKMPLRLYRHTRTLVTLVAAVLILVIGLNAMRMVTPFGAKKDNGHSEDDKVTGYSRNEIYSTDRSASSSKDEDMDMGDPTKAEAQKQYNDAVEDAADLYKADGDADMLLENDAVRSNDDMGYNLTAFQESVISFDEITMLESANVHIITINSQATDETVVLSEHEEIDEFFLVMRSHGFLYDTEGRDDAAQYIIKIATEDRGSQMIIGEKTIRVENTYNDATSQSIYRAIDQNKFQELIEELLK